MLRFRNTKYGMNSTNTCIRSCNCPTQVLDSPSKLQIGEIKERLFKNYIDNYQLPLLLYDDILCCIVASIIASPRLRPYLLLFFFSLKLHSITFQKSSYRLSALTIQALRTVQLSNKSIFSSLNRCKSKFRRDI